MLKFNSSLRYFLLDAVQDKLVRYLSIEDCPVKPRHILSLSDISKVERVNDRWYCSSNAFYLVIDTLAKQDAHVLISTNEQIIRLWEERIKNAVRVAFWIKEVKKFRYEESTDKEVAEKLDEIFTKIIAFNTQEEEVSDESMNTLQSTMIGSSDGNVSPSTPSEDDDLPAIVSTEESKRMRMQKRMKEGASEM